jgi:hypothetical protein
MTLRRKLSLCFDLPHPDIMTTKTGPIGVDNTVSSLYLLYDYNKTNRVACRSTDIGISEISDLIRQVHALKQQVQRLSEIEESFDIMATKATAYLDQRLNSMVMIMAENMQAFAMATQQTPSNSPYTARHMKVSPAQIDKHTFSQPAPPLP